MSSNHAQTGASGRHWKTDWKYTRRRVLHRDDFACTRCGSRARLEVHHKTPLEAGGTNDPCNLVTLCRGCHIEENRRQNRVHEVDGQNEWENALALKKRTGFL